MKRIAILLACMLPALSLGAQTTLEVSLSEDSEAVLYGFLPRNPTGRAVVCCPGGGYTHLSLENEGTAWKDFFNERGIALFVLKYRMPGGDRTIPMGDALSALDMVRSHASDWRINPHDVGIMGFSAGGHLAAITATRTEISRRPDFQILFYPVISMNPGASHGGSCRNFLGEENLRNRELIQEYSADAQVKKHTTPPAILFACSDDGAVPVATNALAYTRAVMQADGEASLHLYPDGGHGWGRSDSFKYQEEVQKSLSDWLEHLPAVSPSAIRVGCIGDSITDGFRVQVNFRNNFPAVLQALLGEGYLVKNFGISARTLMNSGDNPYQKEYAFAECKDFLPDIVVINLGTNDTKPDNWAHKEDFEKDLQDMVNQLRALPSRPTIFLCLPGPCGENNFGVNGKIMDEEIIPLIRKVARKNGLPTIDLNSQMQDPSYFTNDHVHPNNKGAAKMAEIVCNSILNHK